MDFGLAIPLPRTRGREPDDVPAFNRSCTVDPSSVGTSITPPRAASAKVTGTRTVRLSPSHEQRVWRDVALDEEVAGGTAVSASGTATLQPDPLSVGDTGGDPRLHLAALLLDAGAVARRARLLDGDAATGTCGAWRRQREEALVVVDDTATATGRAHLGVPGLAPLP